jgi:hypothetical protein
MQQLIWLMGELLWWETCLLRSRLYQLGEERFMTRPLDPERLKNAKIAFEILSLTIKIVDINCHKLSA